MTFDKNDSGLMTSTGLEWDPFDLPLVGLPTECRSVFPTDNHNTQPWLCQIHSLWSMSSATGCNTSTTEENKKCRLKQEEEERRRQWRRAGKEPGSGREEVSLTASKVQR